MQTIGERLEEARKRKGVSIREAAEATKIRGDYLQKFESNHFDLKIPDIYVRGFLRIYAVFLRLPPDKLLHDLAGLHQNEPRPGARTLNREVYGRMDLSVASTKAAAARPEHGPDQPGATPATTPLPGGEPPRGDNNPATFRPRGTQGPPLSPALVAKALLLLLAVAAVVYGAVWGLQTFTGTSSSSSTAKPSLRPDRSTSPGSPTGAAPDFGAPTNPAEPMLKIIALDTVAVKLQNKTDKTVLFDGVLNKGQSQSVPRRDTIDVTADPFEHLQFEIDGRRYPMPGQRAATIAAPKPANR